MVKQKLYIISELFPPDETSTAYILGEIANASAKEYEVHIICGPEVYDTRKIIDREHPFHLDSTAVVHRVKGIGIDKSRTIGKVLSFLILSWRLQRLSRRVVREGDKVLLVTNPAPLVLLMTHMKSRRHFELNLLVHDVFPENTIPAGLSIPNWAYRSVKACFDRAYSRIDRFITIGRDMADIVKKKAGKDALVTVVENWADIENITPIPFPEGVVRVEYGGNIGRVQGLDKLVEELPEGIELHLYGTGAMEKSLKEMKHPRVFFHGPYFRSQQTEVLGACHAAIVTLSEGMYGLGVPSKAYNILAAGRPIIYFGPENGEIGLMIQENGIGYLGWPEKWDMVELKEMGKRARALAESQYSKEAILAKFLDAIR